MKLSLQMIKKKLFYKVQNYLHRVAKVEIEDRFSPKQLQKMAIIKGDNITLHRNKGSLYTIRVIRSFYRRNQA